MPVLEELNEEIAAELASRELASLEDVQAHLDAFVRSRTSPALESRPWPAWSTA